MKKKSDSSSVSFRKNILPISASIVLALIIVLGTAVALWKSSFTPLELSDVTVTNVSSGSATLTFLSDNYAKICAVIVPLGEDAPEYHTGRNCIQDDRSDNGFRRSHHISFGELKENEYYSVFIYQKAPPVYVNISQVNVTSLSETEDVNEPHTIFGKILEDEDSPVAEGLVIVTLENDNQESLPLSGYIDNGNWSLDISTARTQKGDPFEITNETFSHISLLSGDGEERSLRVKYGYDRPVGQLVMRPLEKTDLSLRSQRLTGSVHAQLPDIDINDIDIDLDDIDVDMDDMDINFEDIDTDIDDIELPDIDMDDIDLDLEGIDDLIDMDEGLGLEPLPSVDPIMDDILPESSILNNPDLLDDLTKDLNLSTSLGDFSSSVLGISGNLNVDTANILGNMDVSIDNIQIDGFDSFSTGLDTLTPDLVFDLKIMNSINLDLVNNITVDDVIQLPQLQSITQTYLDYDGSLPQSQFSLVSLQSLFSTVGQSGAINAADGLEIIIGLVSKAGNSEITAVLFETLSGFIADGSTGIVGQLIGLLTENTEIVGILVDLISQDGNVGESIVDLAMRYAGPIIEKFLGMLGLSGAVPGSSPGSSSTQPERAPIAPCCCFEKTLWNENECTNCSQSDPRWERGTCENSLSPCCCNGKTLYSENGCKNCSQSDPRWERGACEGESPTVGVPPTSQPQPGNSQGTCKCTTTVKFMGTHTRSATYTTTESECTVSFCKQKAKEACAAQPPCNPSSMQIVSSKASFTPSSGSARPSDLADDSTCPFIHAAIAETMSAENGSVTVSEPGRYAITIGSQTTYEDIFSEKGGTIILFNDDNGNGYMDEEETYIGDTVEDVDVEKIAEIQRIHLRKGLNFIGFDVVPENIPTSEELFAFLANQGAQIASISEFRSGRWNTHVVFGAEGYSAPITLEEGRGYVINARTSGDIVLYGDMSTEDTLGELTAGWNLVGISTNLTGGYYTEVDSVTTERLSGYSEVSIYEWRADTQRFEGYIVKDGDIYGNPFFVTSDRSYFVGVLD